MNRLTNCKIHYINDICNSTDKKRLLPENKAINFLLYLSLHISLLPKNTGNTNLDDLD